MPSFRDAAALDLRGDWGQVEAVHEDGTVDLGYVSASDPSRAVDREEHVPLKVLSHASTSF